MIPKNADVPEFAQMLSSQAKEAFENDIPDNIKDFVTKTICEFITIAGKTLADDKEHNYNMQQTQIICQLVGEWTFHKGVGNYKNGISEEYWKPILQQIAFAVYESAQKDTLNGSDLDTIINNAEDAVNSAYKNCIEELDKNGKLKKSKEEILKQSNLNDYVEGSRKENNNKSEEDKKEKPTAKFIQKEKSEAEFIKKEKETNPTSANYTLLILSVLAIPYIHSFFYIGHHFNLLYIIPIITEISAIIEVIFNIISNKKDKEYIGQGIFWVIGSIILLFYTSLYVLHHPNYYLHFCIFNILVVFINTMSCLAQFDTLQLLKSIEEVKQDMKNLVNPNRMYERLGVDILSLQVGTNLIVIADPEQEGQLLSKIAVLRQHLTDELGYIIPNLRIMDCTKIGEYEYLISVRGNIAARGEVYPGRVLVTSEEWEKTKLPVPNDAVITNDPVFETKCYWVFENDIPKNNDITFVEATDVIIEHLKKCVLKNVDKIITKTDIIKLMELTKAQDPTFVNDLIPKSIGVTDLRKIYVNLIREGVCVKDILFIFERLTDYARFSKEPDILSERLRIALNNQISLNYANEDNILYAVKLSEEIEDILEKHWEMLLNEQNILFNNENVKEVIEIMAKTIESLKQQYERMNECPVIVCSPKIRLALFRLLENYVPDIAVISYLEVVQDVKLEILDTINIDKNHLTF